MIKFPHKVSIFNRQQSDEDEVYVKALVKGVLMIIDETSTLNKTGLVAQNPVQLYIPRKAVSLSKYVKEFDYNQIAPDEIDKYYTLRKGDFIAFGDVELNGVSANEFRNQNGNLYEITGVTDYNYGRLEHIVVVAR